MFRCCFAAQECDAALFLFEKLFDTFQFILSRTKTNFLCLVEGCLPFNVRIGILEMIVGAMPSRLCKMLAKLTVFDRSCLQAGIGTRLIKSNRSKLANIPISGRIGASFSPCSHSSG